MDSTNRLKNHFPKSSRPFRKPVNWTGRKLFNTLHPNTHPEPLCFCKWPPPRPVGWKIYCHALRLGGFYFSIKIFNTTRTSTACSTTGCVSPRWERFVVTERFREIVLVHYYTTNRRTFSSPSLPMGNWGKMVLALAKRDDEQSMLMNCPLVLWCLICTVCRQRCGCNAVCTIRSHFGWGKHNACWGWISGAAVWIARCNCVVTVCFHLSRLLGWHTIGTKVEFYYLTRLVRVWIVCIYGLKIIQFGNSLWAVHTFRRFGRTVPFVKSFEKCLTKSVGPNLI